MILFDISVADNTISLQIQNTRYIQKDRKIDRQLNRDTLFTLYMYV